MLIVQSQEDYRNKIFSSNKNIILVDFFAEWCGPCKLLTPKLENLEKKYDNIEILKVDVDNDNCSQISELYKITCMPTIIFLKDKKNQENFKVEGNNIELIEENIKKLINL